ncbi:MAG: cytochrome P450 [Bacteroidota bacterium]
MPIPPVIPRPTVLAGIGRTLRRPIDSFTDYFGRYGDNFILAVGGSRRTHMTIDADVFQHVLQKNHRNYEKSEIQTDQMARYFGYGLLTNSGQSWLTQRRLIQPGFHRKRLENLTAEMQAVIREQGETLAEVASRGGKINLHDFTRETVFRIIVRAIFTDGFGAEESEWLGEVMDKIQRYVIYPVRVPFLRAPLRWLGFERKYLAMTKEIRAHVQRKIDARRAGAPKDDLLQMLLDSHYEDTGAPMSDEQLIDEIIILFAAGHETSANSLAWTIWLLLQHPEELAKVRTEINTAAADGPIDFEGVRRLPYLTQVIEESLRLYPSAWITDRVALGEDQATTYDIHEGTVVGLFIYGLHRNPAYWEDPNVFRPERMAPAAKKARHPMAFLPFGGGPRLCIGNHFAMLEMQLLLVEVLSRFDFQLPAKADRVGVKPLITLHMDREVELGVRELGS